MNPLKTSLNGLVLWLCLLPFLFVFLGPSRADAGLWVEPYAGYFAGSFESDFYNDGNITSRFAGAAAGLKLGYQFDALFFALDGTYLTVENKIQDDNSVGFNSESATVSGTMLGAVAGARAGTFRFWGGTIFDTRFTSHLSTGDFVMKTPSAYKVGIGVDWFRWFELNFEGIVTRFTTVEYGGTTSPIGGTGPRTNLNASSMMISLSFPWDSDGESAKNSRHTRMPKPTKAPPPKED